MERKRVIAGSLLLLCVATLLCGCVSTDLPQASAETDFTLDYSPVNTPQAVALINPKVGYINGITWGMSLEQVQTRLGSTVRLASVKKTNALYSQFKNTVTIYADPDSQTMYYFNEGKLFSVQEFLTDPAAFTDEGLKARYKGVSSYYADLGNGPEIIYSDSNNEYSASINITFRVRDNKNIAGVALFSTSMYSKAQLSASAKASAGIVALLTELAQKLVQPAASTNKAIYAFVTFTSDDGNALLETYVTDALCEAMLNTGEVKIVERESIEKIMGEQRFQASTLLNENTAVEIGNLSGANYVCYGTVKDLGDQIALNVKVVEVSTAELCAMGRETVAKDKYLKGLDSGKRTVANTAGSGAASTAKPATGTAKPAGSVNSVWQVQTKDVGIYTSYTFILKAGGLPFLFVGYDKFDIPTSSRVRAGIHWHNNTDDVHGSYDIKEDNGKVTTKSWSHHWWTYDAGWGHAWFNQKAGFTNNWSWNAAIDSSTKINGLDAFAFTYNDGESARFFVDLFGNNKVLTVRHNNESFRFATEGFWQTVEAQGLTRAEIMNAIANEEF